MSVAQLIRELDKLLDDHSSLEKCVELLYNLQRDNGPVAQILTILKYDKPVLYSILKTRVRNPGIKMLFELTMNYQDAKNTLEM